MGRVLLSLLVISFVLTGPLCYSQTSVKVSDPKLEMRDNTILISYDILNSEPDEKYSISIVIKDEEGRIINASSLDGDIGEEVSGGSNKQITWNLEADNIFLDAYVFVQINARVIPPPAPVIIEPEEETVQDDQAEEPPEEVKQEEVAQEEVTKEEPPPKTKSTTYSRTGIVLQSIAFPGLGLSRVTGKPHWLRGVAGYGCIVGSIVLNRQAANTYNGIDDLVDFNEINAAYDKALQQDNISQVLSFTAIGIWITDFVWTMVGTSDLKKQPYSAESAGLSIGSNIDPLSNIPMVSVRYRF